MPLSKIHSTLTSDHILLDGTDSTGANANSSVILDSSASNTDVGSLMSYEAGAVDAAITLPVGRNDLSLGTGGILQVKQGTQVSFITLNNSGTAAVFADIFLEVDIVPTSASNNILLLASFSVSGNTSNRFAYCKFVGGNTDNFISSGRAIGSRTPCHQSVYFVSAYEQQAVTMNFLDSPATTDSVKYKVQVAPSNTSGNLFVNKFTDDSDTALIPASSAVITAMEVIA